MSGSGPTLFAGELPSWSIFKGPPDHAPPAIPPPFEEPSFKTPFPIPANVYNAALSYKVPLTIASVYATSVLYLNWYNRKHGNKPWAISKTRAFKAFVIAHNVFLAIYSAVTCVAMVRSLKHSIPHYTERNAVVGTIDALCKIHGPRGLGDAATYNHDTSQWENRNRLIKFDNNGLPDSTDVGRIWNEGLAFWGWIFYLSKFYEVLDTAIIIAKGKRSTTLQTYHHAGAMLSMWAGMAYMSPPIWMFALVNSGIHAMMYTYYTVSALGVRVPQSVKRTLTSMQILQFVVGVAYAAIHSFVSYTVPVSVPYQIFEKVADNLNASNVSSAATSATSAAASVVSALTSSATLPPATGVAVAFLKKLVYRAAGEEGLAENIHLAGNHVISDRLHHYADAAGVPNHPQQAIRNALHHERNSVNRTIYRTEYQHVPCIDTPGQAFAIYLNMIYLAPLTLLFVRFFVKSYIRRTSGGSKNPTKRTAITNAGRDAFNGVDREIESFGKAAEDGVGTAIENTKNSVNSVRGRGPTANGDHNDAIHNTGRNLKSLGHEAEDGVGTAFEKTKDAVNNLRGRASKANSDQSNASHKASHENESRGYDTEDGVGGAVENSKIPIKTVRGRGPMANGDPRAGSLSPANKQFVDSVARKVSRRLEEVGETEEAEAERAKELAKDIVSSASSPTKVQTPKDQRALSPASNGKA
ncbi:GNS1/SUR4 family-domain-containing protein [Massariosphaeria phaeospora]|uniref:Elongation of fatty acids protein n=1 Tax=Massariosphaeria phaeospora TaxID=100035 RepID=A0A7C8IH88_9PLEO|nr:GNS1/SUR4 family-domain-containing protein [Massariosphaeria phaeospora]